MTIFYIISLILFLIGFLQFIISFLLKSNYNLKLNPKKNDKFAILIPAKDESKVIDALLKSIKKQTKNMSNTYVIVESLTDKTCFITRKYKANIILRKNLIGRRKGYALDEAIKEILKTKKYDLYFIFDADNVLEDNFIDKMLETYKKGYDIGVGYRNIKNGSNIVSATSGLTFSLVNIFNKFRNRHKQIIAISGTGYYINGEIINKLNGFPFTSLTEDYELSLYASANGLSTFYNEEAIFYDEQPTSIKISIKQRTRWVKGFFEARKKRLIDIKNDQTRKLGLTPYIFIVSGLLLFVFSNFFGSVYYVINNDNHYLSTFLYLFLIIFIIYIIFIFATIYILVNDPKLNLSKSLKIKAILFNPIFLMTYVICFFKAILNKDVQWEKIEHKDNLKRY